MRLRWSLSRAPRIWTFLNSLYSGFFSQPAKRIEGAGPLGALFPVICFIFPRQISICGSLHRVLL